MKKNVILLSFIILACIFAILYHSYFFLPNKIDCINILINETEKEVNTLEYDSFIKIITKGKKNASIDLDDFKSFIINYNLKNGEKINYKIYRSFLPAASSLRTRRSTFPMMEVGSWSRISTSLGRLYPVSFSLQKVRISCSVAFLSGMSVTKAFTFSPPFESGTPITATRATLG